MLHTLPGWLNINSGNGRSTGTVNYSVNPNTDLEKREGILTIAGKIFYLFFIFENGILLTEGVILKPI